MGDASRPSIPRTLLAAVAALAVVGTLFAITRGGQGPDPEGSRGVETEAQTPQTTAALPADPVPADPAPGGAIPENDADAVRPGFDIVRVTPDGSALVAGRAAPGARVTIAADGTELAATRADADGNFVAIFEAAPSAAPRAMSLESEAADGSRTTSDEVVLLLPGVPPKEPTPDADASPAGGGGLASGNENGNEDGSDGEAPPAEAGDTGFAPADGEAHGPDIAATAILRPDAVEARLAVPVIGDPAAPRRVTLASISYADAGEVTLAGAGTAGARLRAYVDDDLAREAAVGPDGRWTLDLADVAAGLYRLRIDQLAADGRVASRVETPFQRDFPTLPRHRPGSDPGAGVSITVQPGANLWTIARTHYGSGVLYSQIFTANRDLIRDPDLIYPGQVLALPVTTGE